MTKLLFQGHGSFRIETNDKSVIYVDPYAGQGYEKPADIILVTHQHGDHNQIDMVTKKEDCVVIQNFDALKNGRYMSYTINGVIIQAVEAYNQNHAKAECVGYIIEVDNKKIYAAGDTSKTKAMSTFKKQELDYALLPIDGIYNMNPQEATKCADLIGAKHSIPIHMKPGALFDEEVVKRFTARNRLIIQPTEEILL